MVERWDRAYALFAAALPGEPNTPKRGRRVPIGDGNAAANKAQMIGNEKRRASRYSGVATLFPVAIHEGEDGGSVQ